MNIKVLAIAISVLVFLLVIELIRSGRLTFKYAVSWLAASAIGIVVAVFDRVLFHAAHALGFTLASNFIFFLIGVALVFLSLVLTVYLCQQTVRSERLAQDIALMKLEIEKLKHNNPGKKTA